MAGSGTGSLRLEHKGWHLRADVEFIKHHYILVLNVIPLDENPGAALPAKGAEGAFARFCKRADETVPC